MALRLRLASPRCASKWSADWDCIPMPALDLVAVDRLNCQSKARFSPMSRASRSEPSCVAPFSYS
jgi:hypothetical protein